MSAALFRRVVFNQSRSIVLAKPRVLHHKVHVDQKQFTGRKLLGRFPSFTSRKFTGHSFIVRSSYAVQEQGQKDSFEYRLFISDKTGKIISPWHDIPLFTEDGLLNFVCEIPKETSAKMELALDEENTPIKQDTKNEKLRFYPYNINWNYGLFPQTWEDPDVENEALNGIAGDNDPVDCVEIGSSTLKMGGVYNVKPIGVFAMIDDGELDWKVIAINKDDPKASSINDVEDVERAFPGELEKIMIWFRDYKIPDGKPANAYGYNSKCMNKEFCIDVIKETNGFWKALKSGSRINSEELSLV